MRVMDQQENAHVEPQPGRWTVNLKHVGKRTIRESGDSVDLFRLTWYTESGQAAVFVTGPELGGLAEMFGQASNGASGLAVPSVADIERLTGA